MRNRSPQKKTGKKAEVENGSLNLPQKASHARKKPLPPPASAVLSSGCFKAHTISNQHVELLDGEAVG